MFLLRLQVFPATITEMKWARRKIIITDLDRGAGTNAWDSETFAQVRTSANEAEHKRKTTGRNI
jgi:hypothetical protein